MKHNSRRRVMPRYKLSDQQWNRIASLLPDRNHRGRRAGLGKITGHSLMAGCGFFILALHGVICPNASVLGRASIDGSICGAAMALGFASHPLFWTNWTGVDLLITTF